MLRNPRIGLASVSAGFHCKPARALQTESVAMPHRRRFCAHTTTGHAHAARGQIAEAVADYRKALELNPKHSEADTMNEYILKNS